jgi:hypothetical protein
MHPAWLRYYPYLGGLSRDLLVRLKAPCYLTLSLCTHSASRQVVGCLLQGNRVKKFVTKG